ncbi:MAG TPA: RNase adapter RapZ, partial [Succinivibrionaceae bacterium]|nr:RNase adapter RapZ [Succinivibrio sp.]HAR79240.1 RNase adapter RapZ [Succinivibrionaceae bacterium]
MSVKLELVVVSGRSGSGKSVAIKALEDLGFYCIDNLPVVFLGQLIELAKEHYPKLAVSLDIRNLPSNPSDLRIIYKNTKADKNIKSTIIYLDADDSILIKRYSETRRLHPLSKGKLSLNEAINKESIILKQIASVADLRVDTTNLSLHDLSKQIVATIQGSPEKQLIIIFESFGFKDGIAKDADFVFDSRFLPNPFWEVNLRTHSGLEEPVKKFFSKYPEVGVFIEQIDELLMRWINNIESSNRSYLTVAIGCTGGFHRSVYIAQNLYDRFKSRGYLVQVRHRSLAATYVDLKKTSNDVTK